MTKRERLQELLSNYESELEFRLGLIKKIPYSSCICSCHKVGCEPFHIFVCCAGPKAEIEAWEIEREISYIKNELRIK